MRAPLQHVQHAGAAEQPRRTFTSRAATLRSPKRTNDYDAASVATGTIVGSLAHSGTMRGGAGGVSMGAAWAAAGSVLASTAGALSRGV